MMTNWIAAADSTDISNGGTHEIEINTVSILIVNVNGNFYAIENVCTHDGGTLAEGQIEGDDIVCPRHGAKFCLKTGAVTAPPAYEDIKTYPLRIEGTKIFLQVE